jgi:hypothetical protein
VFVVLIASFFMQGKTSLERDEMQLHSPSSRWNRVFKEVPQASRLAERCANRFPQPVVNVKSLSREGGSDVWRSLQECDKRLQLLKAAAPLSSEE